jgi:hypothetical protein
MSDKKQKAVPPHPPKTVTVPGRVEWPNAGGPEEQTVTMLDYEGSPVVTYSVADKQAKPPRGAS